MADAIDKQVAKMGRLRHEAAEAYDRFLEALRTGATDRKCDNAYSRYEAARDALAKARAKEEATKEAQCILLDEQAHREEAKARNAALKKAQGYADHAEKIAKRLDKKLKSAAEDYKQLVAVTDAAYQSAPEGKPPVGKATFKGVDKLKTAVRIALQKSGLATLPDVHNLKAQPGVLDWFRSGRAQLLKEIENDG